jgi:hypothetical protein
MMRPTNSHALVVTVALCVGALFAPAVMCADEDWGELKIDLRYRLESVDDDNPAFTDDALASTLRTTLYYGSPEWNHFSAFVEFEDVSNLGADDLHNNGGVAGLGNGVTDRPLVLDPNVTEVNQAAARFTGLKNATIEAGRLEINLGTQRFIGAVGWRQNHQTFDAFRFNHRPQEGIDWTYIFANNVNRIVGGNKTMKSHLANAEIAIRKAGKLTPYVYALDYGSSADDGLSTTTYGARWQGKIQCRGKWAVNYHLEGAQQKDAGDNPNEVDANYYNVEVGGTGPRFWVRAGMEVLEGSPEDGQFNTPLATLHKYNGWADKFATGTPDNGLEDVHLDIGGKVGSVALTAIYHDFSSDTDSLDYGTEIDFQAVFKSSWNQVFALKVAAYDADDLAFDTTKAMFWTSYRFNPGG